MICNWIIWKINFTTKRTPNGIYIDIFSTNISKRSITSTEISRTTLTFFTILAIICSSRNRLIYLPRFIWIWILLNQCSKQRVQWICLTTINDMENKLLVRYVTKIPIFNFQSSYYFASKFLYLPPFLVMKVVFRWYFYPNMF